MNIDLTDAQKKLLLETLAIALQIQFLKRENTSPLQDVIECIAMALQEEGKLSIFTNIFREVK